MVPAHSNLDSHQIFFDFLQVIQIKWHADMMAFAHNLSLSPDPFALRFAGLAFVYGYQSSVKWVEEHK